MTNVPQEVPPDRLNETLEKPSAESNSTRSEDHAKGGGVTNVSHEAPPARMNEMSEKQPVAPNSTRSADNSGLSFVLLIVVTFLAASYYFFHLQPFVSSKAGGTIGGILAALTGAWGVVSKLLASEKQIPKGISALAKSRGSVVVFAVFILVEIGAIVATKSIALSYAKDDDQKTYRVKVTTDNGAPFKEVPELYVGGANRVAGRLLFFQLRVPRLHFDVQEPTGLEYNLSEAMRFWPASRIHISVPADLSPPLLRLIRILPGPKLARRLPLKGQPENAIGAKYSIEVWRNNSRIVLIDNWRLSSIITGAEFKFLPSPEEAGVVSIKKQWVAGAPAALFDEMINSEEKRASPRFQFTDAVTIYVHVAGVPAPVVSWPITIGAEEVKVVVIEAGQVGPS